MTSCLFCELEWVVDENELARVVASNSRLTFGHLLVVVRRHVERPWEMWNGGMMVGGAGGRRL